MQLRYGSYYFPVNGVQVETRLQRLLSDAKIEYGFRYQFKVSGYLEGNTSLTSLNAQQSYLSSQSLLLDQALKIQYQDLTLLQDDGATPSATTFISANSYTGVIITDGPNFPGKMGNDYVNQRAFDFSGYVEYASSPLNMVTSFREQLAFDGGGPIRIARRAINGSPQIQIPYLQTEYTAVQTGQAEGLRGYPAIPAPLFPFALAKSGQPTYMSPVRNASNYERWGVRWEYRYVSATPLVGLPNLWTTP